MFKTRPEINGTFGVVTSTHWLATAAGMSILEQGGNAFDAAVATGTSLHVTEPHQNGPGGEMPLVLYSATTDAVKVVCGQGTAPKAATPAKFKELGMSIIPGNGLLPAVVPGSFGAWMLLLAEYGTMSLRDVMTPAITYARDGFFLLDNAATIIRNVEKLFREEWPASAEVWLPGGKVPEPRKLFQRPHLAATFERIVREAESASGNRQGQIEAARRCWYEGFVAETVDKFFRENALLDTTGERHHGLLTGHDMAAWRATVEDPVSYDYENYTVHKAGPWSQGPVFLQQLALLKGFDLRKMGSESAEFVHTVTECAKLAFADRDAYYGDPDFVDVPLQALLSDDYNALRRRLVTDSVSLSLRPGQVDGFHPNIPIRPKGSTAIAMPESLDFNYPRPRQSTEQLATGDTTHFDIIDRFGNMISGTPSGSSLHMAPVVSGLGFGMPARAQMFWLEPDCPGVLVPGKRPRTTLTPTIAMRDGKPYMAFGTPGGDCQDQWALQAFLRHVHFGLDLQQAIDAPTFHTYHLVDSFFPREYDPGHLAIEGRFSEAVLHDLRRRGHRLEIYDDYALGYVTAAAADGGLLKAGASPRDAQCYAAGR
ncbi:gamma-glutamyltransferase [Mesorhizobium hungaricum]|jgi:gamma-glutamyltranspeptidase / glutathione hydrolase|uniref:Gamma-glutamyltransferase n=1 Tax=Mesorhizobium hungaricum TaxID=1566387 RepID=A0A1C2E3G1_9HYPH|nr:MULTISPECIES: gamma-glutamyltransferase family protein [Mesorhizobium]MBN9235894.1 gamma-glutamyltransferase family protein [Mesorhizobium sp.]OCX21552.1 gamma-glutamyltransferase [Mesorhizobium hungaricum]